MTDKEFVINFTVKPKWWYKPAVSLMVFITKTWLKVIKTKWITPYHNSVIWWLSEKGLGIEQAYEEQYKGIND